MSGVRCVAAPVFNSRYEVIGAIGISGMIQNMSPERMEVHAQTDQVGRGEGQHQYRE